MLKVVILGAGSSKECGLPLGNEVFENFEYNAGPVWYDFMNKIFLQSAASVRYPTFEMILSLVDTCIKNQQSLGGYSSFHLAEVRESLINSYVEVFKERCPYAVSRFSDCSLMPDAEEVYNNFKWYETFFKQTIKQENDVAIISINYDILIDFVLYEMIEEKERQKNEMKNKYEAIFHKKIKYLGEEFKKYADIVSYGFPLSWE